MARLVSTAMLWLLAQAGAAGAHDIEAMRWSAAGPIRGMECVQWYELADPHSWDDNFLCTPHDWRFQWSAAGPLQGMRCIQINEPADPHTWVDNYFCVPPRFPYEFIWSSDGAPDHVPCVRIAERADPHRWRDNYLCYRPL